MYRVVHEKSERFYASKKKNRNKNVERYPYHMCTKEVFSKREKRTLTKRISIVLMIRPLRIHSSRTGVRARSFIVCGSVQPLRPPRRGRDGFGDT